MQPIWDPFDPVTYLLHTIVGTAGVIAAGLALAARKGSRTHVAAGRTFGIAATVAACTAIVFSITRLSPFAVLSALIVLALLAGAVLALRPPTRGVRAGETAAAAVMGVCGAALVVMSVVPLVAGAPTIMWLQPALYAPFPAVLPRDRRAVPAPRPGAAPRPARRPTPLAHGVRARDRRTRAGRHLRRRAGIAPAGRLLGPFAIWPLLVLAFRRDALVVAAARHDHGVRP